jgi:hypothetical protein
VDLLRPGAVPALILALGVAVPASACSVEGTWKVESEPLPQGHRIPLTQLVDWRYLEHLRSKDPEVSSGRDRSKPLHDISHVVMTGRGVPHLDFRDASNRSRARIRMSTQWRCEGDVLVRRNDGWVGNAKKQWIERVEEKLSRTPEGDLLYSSSTTVIDPPGPTKRRVEARFKAGPKP